MKITKEETVLFLAPHTDDAEFGAGGTMAKLLNQGNIVHHVAFSTAQVTSEHGMMNQVLVTEIKEANRILGLAPENLVIHDFQVRRFMERRQEILDLLIYYSKQIKPDIVFVPSGRDIHQDHATISQEAIRAFKTKTILGYELVWNNLSFDLDVFIEISEQDITKKINACAAYNSQAYRNPYRDDFIRALAVARGVQVKKQYAEVFEAIRINL